MSPIFPRALTGAFQELEFRWHFSFNIPVAAEESIGLKGKFFLLLFSLRLVRWCEYACGLLNEEALDVQLTCPNSASIGLGYFPKYQAWQAHLNKLKWERRRGSNQGMLGLGMETFPTCSPPDEWSELGLKWQHARPVWPYLKKAAAP